MAAARRYIQRSVVFQVRLPGGDWETKTLAQPGTDFARERAVWNRRGYQTRTRPVSCVTAYRSADAERLTIHAH